MDQNFLSAFTLIDQSVGDEEDDTDSTKGRQHTENTKRNKPASQFACEMDFAQRRWQVTVWTEAEPHGRAFSIASHLCQEDVPIRVLQI